MKLGSILLLGCTLLVGCDSPGFKSKAKTAANAKAADQAGKTETTSGDLNGGMTPLTNQTPAVWAPSLTVSGSASIATTFAHTI